MYTKEDLKAFERFRKEASYNSTTRFGWVFNDGTMSHTTGGCHGGMSTHQKYGNRLKYVLCGHQRKLPQLDLEHSLKFVDYMLTDSPYAQYILNEDRDPKTVHEDFYLFDPGAPSNLMVGGMMASRFNTESGNAESATVFGHIRTNIPEIPADYAFILSQFYRANMEKKGSIFPIQPTGSSYHAATSFLYGGKNYIRNYLAKKPVQVLEPYRKTGTYSTITATWGPNENPSNSTTLFNMRPKSKTSKVEYNIFNIIRKGDKGYALIDDADIFSMYEQLKDYVEAA